MLPVVLMPDAELVTLAYLRAKATGRAEPYLSGVTFWNRLPAAGASFPALPYVLVRTIGGSSSGVVIDRSRVDVLVWHATDADRMALAQLLRGLLLAAAGDTAAGVKVLGARDAMPPRRMPDPADPNRQVVMFTVELFLRGTQI